MKRSAASQTFPQTLRDRVYPYLLSLWQVKIALTSVSWTSFINSAFAKCLQVCVRCGSPFVFHASILYSNKRIDREMFHTSYTNNVFGHVDCDRYRLLNLAVGTRKSAASQSHTMKVAILFEGKDPKNHGEEHRLLCDSGSKHMQGG